MQKKVDLVTEQIPEANYDEEEPDHFCRLFSALPWNSIMVIDQ